MFDNFNSFLVIFNELFTLFILFPVVVFLGVYLTVKLKCVQLTQLKMSFSYLIRKDNQSSQGNISHFEAISAVLAGNFGTGNISGMAVAIATGGPGALVWMWVMAFFGAAVQYASCLLGVKYRQKDAEGEYVGGPMYYLTNGLNLRLAGICFSLFTLFGAITVGNFAQINSVILPLKELGLHPLTCSIGIAICVGLVLIGGIQRLARFSSIVVPLKAFLYLATAICILCIHADKILPAINLMFEAAWNPSSFFSGVAGYGMMRAVTVGFGRGLFATDAGTGIVPILQASAKTTDPVIDGVVTLVSPFLVMVVCTMTGLVLIVTGAWQQPGLQSTNMVTYAFKTGLGHGFGSFVVIGALVLFAFTTILAWAYCAEKAIEFLFGLKFLHLFKYFYIALIPVGALINVDLIWQLADLSISMMLATNLVGVIGLSKEVITETRLFFLKPTPVACN